MKHTLQECEYASTEYRQNERVPFRIKKVKEEEGK